MEGPTQQPDCSKFAKNVLGLKVCLTHLYRMIKRRLPLVLLSLMAVVSMASAVDSPNLVIIYTDEHNFRTLGCYRDQLSDAESFIWGEGVKVDTRILIRWRGMVRF